jgi:hypothetical protein
LVLDDRLLAWNCEKPTRQPLAIVLVVVTALTFLFIERPAIRIGARIVRYWTGRRLRPDASGAAPMRKSPLR